jgi:hypothetical protein
MYNSIGKEKIQWFHVIRREQIQRIKTNRLKIQLDANKRIRQEGEKLVQMEDILVEKLKQSQVM